jgi:hypothetical protein
VRAKADALNALTPLARNAAVLSGSPRGRSAKTCLNEKRVVTDSKEQLCTLNYAKTNYLKVDASDARGGCFANDCPHCGAPVDDLYLHSDPDELFFNLSGASSGSVKLTPHVGRIELNGDEHFEVD